MKTPKHIIPFAALAISTGAHAQLGLAGSEYNGLWDLERQPASISTSKNRFEFNLVKAGVGIDNNYLHLSASSLGSFKLGDIHTNGELVSDPLRMGVSGRALDIDARVMGPSAMMRFGNTSIAISTGLRAKTDVSDLEGLLSILDARTLHVDVQENTRLGLLRFSTRQLAWGEAGITLAQNFHLTKRLRVHGAVTGKYLLGMHGAYVRNGAPLLTVNLGTQQLSDVNIEYGMSDVQATAKGRIIQGSGIGADAGVVVEWLRPRKCGKEEAKYVLRFGAAITDIGAIHFGGAAHTNAIRNGSTTLIGFGDLAVDDIASLDTALSSLFLGDEHASEQHNSLRMALPTALCTSIDWSVVGQLHLHAEGTLGLDRGLNSVREADMLSLAPRFGGRLFEVGMPVSFYRMRDPRVGINVRVGGFMIGSDKVGSLIGLTDIGGMDIYMGIRIALKDN